MEKKMETTIMGYMGGCQNYGPFLDLYYNTAPNMRGTQKGTIILTTTHIPGPKICMREILWALKIYYIPISTLWVELPGPSRYAE